jgi:hypothetical protein
VTCTKTKKESVCGCFERVSGKQERVSTLLAGIKEEPMLFGIIFFAFLSLLEKAEARA